MSIEDYLLNFRVRKVLIVLKIVLIGDGGVGKTAIREQYLGKGFQSQYVLTIGADFALSENIVNGTAVKYQIWDLAGQERFDVVREVYYRGALGALLVYDVTRPESFYNIPKWVNELWTNNGRDKVPIILVGNKMDLRETFNETISPKHGRSMAQKLSKLTSREGFTCHYIETSAKTGNRIPEAFSLLGTNILKFAENRKIIRQTAARSTQSLVKQPVIKQ
ncbi:MAG: Rab family GTPase [Candidatus Hodarchaeota archaeon]